MKMFSQANQDQSTAELTHVGEISLNPYVNLCKKPALQCILCLTNLNNR